MDFDIRKEDKVITADGKEIGLANMLYIDPAEDNPILPHDYLLVVDYTSSKKYFIPVEQIDTERGEHTIKLKVTEADIEIYEREPEAINSEQVQQEPLAQVPPVIEGEEVATH